MTADTFSAPAIPTAVVLGVMYLLGIGTAYVARPKRATPSTSSALPVFDVGSLESMAMQFEHEAKYWSQMRSGKAERMATIEARKARVIREAIAAYHFVLDAHDRPTMGMTGRRAGNQTKGT